MNTDIDKKAVEIKSNLDNKIKSYSDRANLLVSKDNKIGNTTNTTNTTTKKSFFNFSFNFNSKLNIIIITSAFILGFIILFYILKFFKPEFICKKVINEKTHFHEHKICIYKHLLYTFIIAICISVLVYLGYFIYVTKFKK